MTDNLLIDLQKTVRSKETFTFHDYFNMVVNQKLREQIFDFQTFLIKDLWEFSK